MSRVEIPAWGWQGGLLCAGVGIGVLTGIDPKLGLLAAIGLCFVGLVLADLTIGLAIFVVITFLDLLAIAPGLGITKLFGALLVLSWLAKVATTPRASRANFLSENPGLSYIAFAFLAWVALSALWAELPGRSEEAFLRFALNMLLFPIVYTAVRRRRDVVLVLSAFILGALASAVVGTASGIGVRLGGATVEANELAATLVAGMALAGGLAAASTTSSAKQLAGGAAALCAVGVFLTASRAGLLAIGVVLVAALLFAGRLRGPIILGGSLVAVSCLAYFALLAPPEARERVTTLETTGRADVWTVAWRMAEDNPVQGVGANNFVNSSVHYLLEPGAIERSDFIVDQPKVAHNVYLHVWAELGAVGLALFLSVLYLSLRSSVRATSRFRRLGDRQAEMLSRAVVLALLGLLTADFFASTQFSNQLWLLVALGPALAAISRTKGAETSRDLSLARQPAAATARR